MWLIEKIKRGQRRDKDGNGTHVSIFRLFFLAVASTTISCLIFSDLWRKKMDECNQSSTLWSPKTNDEDASSEQNSIILPKSEISTQLLPMRRLPTLEELTSIPANFSCPEGYFIFENIVLPQSVTHANYKIPKVIHMTAKSRCVSDALNKHLSKWKLSDHSVYLHDDAAVHKLFDYIIDDRYGYELVQGLSLMMTCISSGATMSDVWRYAVVYHFGGIYTDIDNGPRQNYNTELISPETDSFFFVETIGTMSQYYFASSPHHPVMLHFLANAKTYLYRSNANVMINNPAVNTGPGAVKRGMIQFMRALDPNTTTNGYLEQGIYHGALGSELESELPWLSLQNSHDESNTNISSAGDGGLNMDKSGYHNEYPPVSEFSNRTVTVHGSKKSSKYFINRSALGARNKNEAWEKMNMTHYAFNRREHTGKNKITCQQHASRMMVLRATNTSFYYNKSRIADLFPRYEYEYNRSYYVDLNTNDAIIPWKTVTTRQ